MVTSDSHLKVRDIYHVQLSDYRVEIQYEEREVTLTFEAVRPDGLFMKDLFINHYVEAHLSTYMSPTADSKLVKSVVMFGFVKQLYTAGGKSFWIHLKDPEILEDQSPGLSGSSSSTVSALSLTCFHTPPRKLETVMKGISPPISPLGEWLKSSTERIETPMATLGSKASPGSDVTTALKLIEAKLEELKQDMSEQ